MVPPSDILALARKSGLVRARELREAGLHSAALSKLVAKGQLIRLERGLYAPAGRSASEYDNLAIVAIKYPQAVFCLLTALRMHDLTTQSPHEIWVAVDVKARAPALDYPPLRIVRFSGDALHEGNEQKSLDGVAQLLVTSIEKTITDCFKFRNKIGLDIAIEALHQAWQEKRINMDELWRCAKICRVHNVMRPYLESLH
jgi:predicted transcriptional regulator of viral defense system